MISYFVRVKGHKNKEEGIHLLAVKGYLYMRGKEFVVDKSDLVRFDNYGIKYKVIEIVERRKIRV